MKVLIQLFSLKFIASLLGLLYSILQVRYFGASRLIEIYFAAQSLVYLVMSLTQSGQLAEVFLPEYHRLNTIEKGLGYKGLNVVINRMLLYGGALLILLFFLAPYLIQLLVPGFSTDEKEFAVLIFRILLPVLCLVLANSFYITVLNAEERFGRAEFLGLTNSLVNILVLIVLYPYIELWALVISFVLGKLIEYFFYRWQLAKGGYRAKWILSTKEFDHFSFFSTVKSTFMYVGATQVYNFVLTAGISFLPEGTYAIFKYVQTLSNKIKGLFIQPFLTVFFTKFSKLVQEGQEVIREFTKNFMSILYVNAIIIIGTVVLGDYIIDLIWGGKKFDQQDVQLAYIFLLFNVVAILISSIGGIYRKMAVSHGYAKKLYSYWVVAQLLTAVASYFLIKYFSTNGLFLVIPINTFLMCLSSILVYRIANTKVSVRLLNKNFLIIFLLVLIAVICKFYFLHYLSNESYSWQVVILMSIGIVLILFPVINTYKTLK